MTITFDLPIDLEGVLEGLEAFLRAEVMSRHDRHPELLLDPRGTWDATGRYRPEVLELAREVREASAKAGYYLMTAPRDVGGAELGYEATYRVWETIFRICGTRNWLGYNAVAHWTKGPSPIFSHMRRDRDATVVNLPNLLDGVYFLRNGFPECVEWNTGVPQSRVHVVDRLEDSGAADRLILRWNGSSFVPAP